MTRIQRKLDNARIRSIQARYDAVQADTLWSTGGPEFAKVDRLERLWAERLKSKGLL